MAEVKKEKGVSLADLAKQVLEILADVGKLKHDNAKIKAKIGRMSDNWKLYARDYIGRAAQDDGKLNGNVRIGLLFTVFVASLVIGSMAAEDKVIAWQARNGNDCVVEINADRRDDSADVGELIMTATGTMKIDVGGTTAATMTTTGIVATIFGDLTVDDINMGGSVSDSLGLNITKSASVTGLAATVNLGNLSGTGINTDYIIHKLLTMNNDSSESIDWGYVYTIIDDDTTNTEDSAIEVYIQIDGTATKALDINASGTAIAGAMDAANVTVDAGAGVDNQAAGTLVLGAATATRVEIADVGVITDIEGPLDVAGIALITGVQTNTANLVVNGTQLQGDGATIIRGFESMNLEGAMVVTGLVTTIGNASVGGVLAVTGAQTNTANLVVNGTQLQGDGATIIRGFESMNLEGALVVTGVVTTIGNASVGGVLAVTGAQTNTADLVVNGVQLKGDGSTIIRGFESMNLEGTLVSTGLVTCIAGSDMGDQSIVNVQGLFCDVIAADGGSAITTSNDWTYIGGLTVNGAAIAGDGATVVTNVANYSVGTQAGYTGTFIVQGAGGIDTNKICFSGGIVTNVISQNP